MRWERSERYTQVPFGFFLQGDNNEMGNTPQIYVYICELRTSPTFCETSLPASIRHFSVIALSAFASATWLIVPSTSQPVTNVVRSNKTSRALSGYNPYEATELSTLSPVITPEREKQNSKQQRQEQK